MNRPIKQNGLFASFWFSGLGSEWGNVTRLKSIETFTLSSQRSFDCPGDQVERLLNIFRLGFSAVCAGTELSQNDSVMVLVLIDIFVLHIGHDLAFCLGIVKFSGDKDFRACISSSSADRATSRQSTLTSLSNPSLL